MTAPAAITRPLAPGKKRVGTVVFFDKTRWFGFIKEPAGREVFFNGQHVAGGKVLGPNDRVSFVERPYRDGRPCAKQIELIEHT